MKPKSLKDKELDKLVSQERILEYEGKQPVVWLRRTGDGDEIIKRIKRKKGLSSDWFKPYAQRFIENALELSTRGVRAPEISAYYRLEDSADAVVIYRCLPGESFADTASNDGVDPADHELVTRLATIYADLHAKGVLFRSVHLSNILLQADGGYALIDITDVKFTKAAASLSARASNLGYAWAHPRDAAFLTESRRQTLLDDYVKAAKLDDGQAEAFRTGVIRAYEMGKEKRLKRRRKKAAKTRGI